MVEMSPLGAWAVRALSVWSRWGWEDPDALSQPEPASPSEPGCLKVSLGKSQLPCYRGALLGWQLSSWRDRGHCHPAPGLVATKLAFLLLRVYPHLAFACLPDYLLFSYTPVPHPPPPSSAWQVWLDKASGINQRPCEVSSSVIHKARFRVGKLKGSRQKPRTWVCKSMPRVLEARIQWGSWGWSWAHSQGWGAKCAD